MTILDKAIDIVKLIRDKGTAKIKFRKEDGSERIMVCTLDMQKIPVKDRPKRVNLDSILNLAKNGIIHVYDLEKKGWRSVKCTKKIEFLD